MAFAEQTVVLKGREPRTGMRPLELKTFTKLTGDTTGTITLTRLRRIRTVRVYDAAGARITGATVTKSASNPKQATLANLGAGTAGTIEVVGYKRSR